ncbi:MAG: SAP domain-containing protein [Gammaproteobacteria bacterium]|nr:SAP domain-containing protein [Gammaproteobacteria bacterium]
MKVNEVKKIAKLHGVKTTRKSKADIIKQIQIVEGNFDCFATPSDGYCDQDSCLWRPDCFKAA